MSKHGLAQGKVMPVTWDLGWMQREHIEGEAVRG